MMRAPLPADPRQHRLFAELIETRETHDEPFTDPDGSWGTRIVRPAGKDWRVSDFSHDKKTRWMRRRGVIPPQLVSGRWRRR